MKAVKGKAVEENSEEARGDCDNMKWKHRVFLFNFAKAKWQGEARKPILPAEHKRTEID